MVRLARLNEVQYAETEYAVNRLKEEGFVEAPIPTEDEKPRGRKAVKADEQQ